ncbi:hypothetical protein OG266_13870 [Streptomyces sp. NBC_00554]|uniref:hypothetical protein n=1 Tax=Streptomyces sp. NBC_00554 TaxID=2903661 RepID=UPI00352E75E7|nr:hypothetical protein OG266_13870 [Streptomyces sp. NBC_00554]
MPAYEVADLLTSEGMSIDRHRLSKFLNGREVPRHRLAQRIHDVLAEVEGADVDAQEVALTRKIMYEAALANKQPLLAREHELAEATERLQLERVRTAESLTELKHELDAARERCRQAEEALEDLAARTDEQITDLKAQRDSARRRIEELEEHMARTEALLRLQSSDIAMMERASTETAVELARWEAGTPQQSVQELYAQRFMDQVAQWRDADEDEKAEEAIQHLCERQPLPMARAVWSQFARNRRWPDLERVMIAIACFGDPLELFHSVRNATFVTNPGRAFWSDDLLIALAQHAPPNTVRRFSKAARERGADGVLDVLSGRIAEQSRARRRSLLSGDAALRHDLRAKRREVAKDRFGDVVIALLRPVWWVIRRRQFRQVNKAAEQVGSAT